MLIRSSCLLELIIILQVSSRNYNDILKNSCNKKSRIRLMDVDDGGTKRGAVVQLVPSDWRTDFRLYIIEIIFISLFKIVFYFLV